MTSQEQILLLLSKQISLLTDVIYHSSTIDQSDYVEKNVKKYRKERSKIEEKLKGDKECIL